MSPMALPPPLPWPYRRGGGAFEFALSPRPNRALDAEWVVIGEARAASRKCQASQPAIVTPQHIHIACVRLTTGPGAGATVYIHIYAWQVLEQGLPLLEELNSVPARKPTATAAVYGAAAKAGGDVRSRIDQDYRPLLKVQVAACAGS